MIPHHDYTLVYRDFTLVLRLFNCLYLTKFLMDFGQILYSKSYDPVCKYASIQVCKDASMQVCAYIQICKYASLQICKYAIMQVCKYTSMQVYARMQVRKYAHICKCVSMPPPNSKVSRGHLVQEQRGRLIGKGPLPKDKFMKVLGEVSSHCEIFICPFYIFKKYQLLGGGGGKTPTTADFLTRFSCSTTHQGIFPVISDSFLSMKRNLGGPPKLGSVGRESRGTCLKREATLLAGGISRGRLSEGRDYLCWVV